MERCGGDDLKGWPIAGLKGDLADAVEPLKRGTWEVLVVEGQGAHVGFGQRVGDERFDDAAPRRST